MPGNLAQSANLSAPAGLRERKKQETREALAAAAMRLALRDGLDHLRIEDIAAEANVSVRTFSNYFASKADALTAYYTSRMLHAAADLRARPASEPLWDAIVRAVLSPMDAVARGHTAPDPASIAELRLMFDAPAVQAGIIQTSLAPGNPFAAAVALRTGTDASQDMYPRLVAAVVAAATQVAIDMFLRAKPPIPLAPLLREALEALAVGLPDPARRRAGS
jgi:AcrR family transcriptional regulator